MRARKSEPPCDRLDAWPRARPGRGRSGIGRRRIARCSTIVDVLAALSRRRPGAGRSLGARGPPLGRRPDPGDPRGPRRPPGGAAAARGRDVSQRRALSRGIPMRAVADRGWSAGGLAEEVRLDRLTRGGHGDDGDADHRAPALPGPRDIVDGHPDPHATASRSTSRSCSATSRDRGPMTPAAVIERPTSRRRSRTPSWPGCERRLGGAGTSPRRRAVIGRAFDLDLLAAGRRTVAELDSPDRSAELAEHQLHPAHAGCPVSYGFRHALICDAIYDEASPDPSRRRLHGRVADTATARRTSGVTTRSWRSTSSAPGRAAEAYRGGGRRGRGRGRLSRRTARLATSTRVAAADRPARPAGATSAADGLLAAARTGCRDRRQSTAADAAFAEARTRYLAAGDQRRSRPRRSWRRMVAARHLLGRRPGRARAAGSRSALTRSRRWRTATGHRPSIRARLLAGLAAAYMLGPPARRGDRDEPGGAPAAALGRRRRRVPQRHADTTLGVVPGLRRCRWTSGWSLLEAVDRDGPRPADLGGRGRARLPDARLVARRSSSSTSAASAGCATASTYAERVELLEPPPLHGGPPRHVLWATGRWDEAEAVAEHALADGRGGITTRITAAPRPRATWRIGPRRLRPRRRRSARGGARARRRGWASCSACRRPCGASPRSALLRGDPTRPRARSRTRPRRVARGRATRPTCSRSR